MIRLIKEENTLKHEWCYLLLDNAGDQVLAFGRGELVFIFNFNPNASFTDYGISIGAGKFNLVLNTDDRTYGGQGLVDASITYRTQPDRQGQHWLKVYIPARSALVLKRMPVPGVHG
jgi:1,4-alpha-glucan branching enzyme